MTHVEALTFEQARAEIIGRVAGRAARPAVETVPLDQACGRVLAETVTADRDYPPEPRSMRDGFALQASSTPGELRVLGEVRAGEPCRFTVGADEAVEIMTGASVPQGADAVVMIEHVSVEGGKLRVPHPVEPGANISPQGSSLKAGAVAVPAGTRLTPASMALLAAVGTAQAPVFTPPRVAILPTGGRRAARAVADPQFQFACPGRAGAARRGSSRGPASRPGPAGGHGRSARGGVKTGSRAFVGRRFGGQV